MKELTEEQMGKIGTLVAEGRKIEAVKLYREYQGVGLAEAKEFIDNVATGKPMTPRVSSDDNFETIHKFLFQGQKIQAIQKYRELKGTSLKESKEFIDQLNEELRAKYPEKFVSAKGQGCLVSLVVFIVVFCYFLTM